MNDQKTHSDELLHEHLAIESKVNELDRQTSIFRAKIDAIEVERKFLKNRQERIADEFAPALRRGSIEWWNGRDKCVVSLDDIGCLSIEPLLPTSALAAALRPRRFSDHELSEAAYYAVFTDSDDDDTCEIISLPGRRVTIKGNAG